MSMKAQLHFELLVAAVIFLIIFISIVYVVFLAKKETGESINIQNQTQNQLTMNREICNSYCIVGDKDNFCGKGCQNIINCPSISCS